MNNKGDMLNKEATQIKKHRWNENTNANEQRQTQHRNNTEHVHEFENEIIEGEGKTNKQRRI